MIIAIDPGISGAAAALNGRRCFDSIIDLPTVGEGKRRVIDTQSFWCWVGNLNPTRIIMENVHSMPKQGLSSTFRFGMAFGALQAICNIWLGRDIELVEPQVWKAYFELSGKDKEESRQLATDLFPDEAYYKLTRKKDHQRAEAMLIAWWANRPPVGRNW